MATQLSFPPPDNIRSPSLAFNILYHQTSRRVTSCVLHSILECVRVRRVAWKLDCGVTLRIANSDAEYDVE